MRFRTEAQSTRPSKVTFVHDTDRYYSVYTVLVVGRCRDCTPTNGPERGTEGHCAGYLPTRVGIGPALLPGLRTSERDLNPLRP